MQHRFLGLAFKALHGFASLYLSFPVMSLLITVVLFHPPPSTVQRPPVLLRERLSLWLPPKSGTASPNVDTMLLLSPSPSFLRCW